MGAATGLGLLDLAVLEACEVSGATSTAPHVRTRHILDVCHDRTGIGPRPAHEALCEMVRPWVLHLPLIDFVGNYGSTEDPPASPRYTESRLTPLGAAALAAERGELGPLPIGLINGDTHVDGRRPPLDPARTVEAIRAAAGSASDAELVAIVGQPSFPVGCGVALDNAAVFAAGRETEVRLSARITTGPDRITISHLPPDCSAHETAQLIEWHVTWQRHGSGGHDADRHDADGHDVGRPGVHRPGPAGPPPGIRDIRDESRNGRAELVLELEPGCDAAAIAGFLSAAAEVRRTLTVGLGEPVAAAIRRAAGDRAALDERLALIAAAHRTAASGHRE